MLDAQQQQPAVQARLADAQRAAATTAENLNALTNQLRFARQATSHASQRLAELAIAAYVDPQASVLATGIAGGNLGDSGKRQVLVSAALQYQRQVMSAARAAADAAQRKVGAAQSSNNGAQAVLNAVQQAQTANSQRLAAAQSNLDVAVAHQGDTRPGSWSLGIMGQSAFTGPELASWYTSRGLRSFAHAPIDQIAGWYVSEGHDEGVRGDMAFIQAIVETGSFSNADTVKLNNFAGIGHCDNCAAGFHFKTPQLGVRAQIQLLKSYAQAHPTYKHHLVDPRLRGPSGCCSTWGALTRTWASDPTYGPKVLDLYRQALEWLITARDGTIPKGA